MKKDELNIDSFTDKQGKNYRKAETLDKAAITDCFSKKGFRVIAIEQQWRHMHGTLEKDNQLFFFKMASTPAIGERTQNETVWNDQIGQLIQQKGITDFAVPHVYETGSFDGKFYYLSSHHAGPLIASENPPQTEQLEQWIDKIIAANVFFLSLRPQDVHFSRDQQSGDSPSPKDKQAKWDGYYTKILRWYKEVEGFQLQDILKEVETLKRTFEPSVNHNDFVPWHMIQEGEKFILIDGEHASAQSPKYYDVCYFYHRVYTSGQNPALAKKYLAKFRDQLPEAEKNTFDKAIRPILATRIIGGFWDAKTGGQTNVTYHQQLRDDFLNHTIV